MMSRIAVLDRELCIHSRCPYQCMKVCPPNRMGEECIVQEKDGPFPVISEDLCIGCGLCVKKCPMGCISIINLAKELTDPIFQYGINTFRLYGLPLPMEKGAASLIGKNGIGKSSAIKILGRSMKPNFAVFDHDLAQEDIDSRLTLDQKRYFERTAGKSKVSMKPQHIDRIRDVFKGTVRELLMASGPQESLGPTLGLFRLEGIAERRIDQLSGGELQKAAIAACCMRDSDIYYFDEATNFLDIEERLRTAVILKNLAETKSVLLAEHDMTFLDYVSEYVYVVYGDENVYGVVSGVKNARAGINEYISGYLKDENVRFRNYEIVFSRHSESSLRSGALLSYEAISKDFGAFSFSAEEGSIRKGEILGLVGKNALGKSTFVKILAGAEKADAGAALVPKISYKPQYISADGSIVSDIFADKKLSGPIFEECKRRLNVGMLAEKSLDQLSGGELQRVALTIALSQDAEIYLFDEPTAFLDIEQRFEFASLLRKAISESGRSAFVVDHDVVFIDAIANRLIVFQGQSSIEGHASAPLEKKEGMNAFLESAGITMRRDKDSHRPRINKPGSALDSEQKARGDYFFYDR